MIQPNVLQPVPATRTTSRSARRVGAVIAGFLTIFLVTTATDMVLHATGIYPELGQRMADSLFLIATAYRLVYGVLGSYVTARLSPDRPMQDALALGAVGLLVSTVGAVVMWDAGPAWYSLAIIAISLPCSWAGGKLCVLQRPVRDLRYRGC
jgi:hypothetical protein